jgi:Mg-chelatase subunit ChlD
MEREETSKRNVLMVSAVVVMATLFGYATCLSAGEPGAKADESKEQKTSKQSATDQQEQESAEKVKKKKSPRIDVVFAIDATGSMGDEIAVIKKEVWKIANGIASGKPTPDVRFGLVFYKDRSDDFVARATPLTRDIDAIHKKLMSTSVGGGGDYPEHVGRGLHTAIDMDWDTDANTSRMLYLVGDAPGHENLQDGYEIETAVAKAKKKKITIHAIGCSGLESGGGKKQFASISKKSGGNYEPLTYHAIVKGDDGEDKSVVYYDGETYEADEVISDDEWKKKGGAKLVEQKKVRRAKSSTRRKARRAEKKNNLDSVVEGSVKKEAASKGVAY